MPADVGCLTFTQSADMVDISVVVNSYLLQYAHACRSFHDFQLRWLISYKFKIAVLLVVFLLVVGALLVPGSCFYAGIGALGRKGKV